MTAVELDRSAIWRAYSALPEKTRAEIVDGEIIVHPMPSNDHQRVVMYLNQLMVTRISRNRGVDASGGVILEPGWSVYLPDLLVAPETAWIPEELGPTVSQVELVVEVVSVGKRDQERDRVTKYEAYARAAIPFYLLVDRYDGDGYVTLFSNPAAGQYLDAHKVPFGEKLTLPAPFEIDVDTAQF